MRALYVLFTVFTVLQILDVSTNGVSAAEGVEDEKKIVRRRTTRTETSNTETQSGVAPRGLDDKPAKRRKKLDAPPPPPEEDEEGNEGENGQDSQPKPTNPTDAIMNLGKTTVGEFKNRGTDLVNGATGMVKSLSRKTSAVGALVGKQRENVEEVAIDGIGMVSEAGDGLKRGTKHVMNSAREIAKEGGNQMHGGLKAATGLAKSTTKMAGTAFTSPLSMAGDFVSVGSNAFSVPMRFSRSASTMINKRLESVQS